MTAEFLAWFLAQKPFRRSRLVMRNGLEHSVDKPEHVQIYNGIVLLGPDLGMGKRTITLADIEEIRQ
jgi:hypothetical protein